MENKDLNSKIVIIGAGASGLSAAHFLKKSGYKNVLVLEKLGRVGGLCRTITEDYMSFDLGANYITLACVHPEMGFLVRLSGQELRAEMHIGNTIGT